MFTFYICSSFHEEDGEKIVTTVHVYILDDINRENLSAFLKRKKTRLRTKLKNISYKLLLP